MSLFASEITQLTDAREDLEEVSDYCKTIEEEPPVGFIGNLIEDGASVGFIAPILNSDMSDEELADIEDATDIIPNFSENDTVPEFCLKVNQALFSLNAFVNVCPTVSNFKYNPKHCDPGFWCGCSDPSLEKCQPSNDLKETFWAGHYTDYTNEIQPIVYTGWASRYPDDYFRCNSTLYCPGKDGNVTYCPQLCKKGFYCPTPAEQIVCPEGHYCRTGSIEPTECRSLDRCVGTGLVDPTGDWYLLLVACATILAVGFVILAFLFLNGKYPFRKKTEEPDSIEDEEQTRPPPRTRRGPGPGGMRRTSSVTTPKPKFTVDLKFSNLQLTLPNGNCIMQGVTGELKARQFTAIMGPSGAGKSTFLSLLSGKTEHTGGTLEVNGKTASLKNYRSAVGFVPQEDIMLRELSVEENIQHSAFMRLPASMSREKKLERVYQVMESLDLLRIRNSVIGDEIVRGISGGQRKRVNVAMELVADPSLLALDEPTSGLDSTTSASLCEVLSDLALTGVNVAAVIHQPKIEILEQFSNVLLLGRGGRTVYMGPTENMELYFENIGFPVPSQTNPADFYMDVIAGLIPCKNDPNFKKEDLFDHWDKHLENSAEEERESNTIAVATGNQVGLNGSVKAPERRIAAGFVTQTVLLFKRCVVQRFRVPQNTIIPVLLSAANGMLIGYFIHTFADLYYGIPLVMDLENPTSNAATQFVANYPVIPTTAFGSIWLFTALAIILISIDSLNTFGDEKAIFRRECFSGTKALSYWCAKTFESGLWLPLYAAVFVTVCVILQPQPIPVTNYFLIIWISMIGDSGVAHIVSLYAGPSNRGIVHLVCCLFLIMVFSGVMIKYKGKNKIFQAFFTFWVSQGYVKGSVTPYEEVFNVPALNEAWQGYDLHYPFSFDIMCGILTASLWHLVALVILMLRAR